MTSFERIRIHNWRQFSNVDIEFHPRLTVLTGANGAGKTTLLHLLNRHWGWNIPLVSAPRVGKTGKRRYWTGFWGGASSDEKEEANDQVKEIGSIDYKDHRSGLLTVPAEVEETYAVQISPLPTLSGVYVPSHRPLISTSES